MLVAILFLLKTEEEKIKMRPPNVLYEVILTWDGNSEDDLDIKDWKKHRRVFYDVIKEAEKFGIKIKRVDTTIDTIKQSAKKIKKAL